MANKETTSFNWWLHTPSESILRMIDLNYKIQCENRERYFNSLFCRGAFEQNRHRGRFIQKIKNNLRRYERG